MANTKQWIHKTKEINNYAMNALADMKPVNSTEACMDNMILSGVVDRAIDSLYMQNKILECIKALESKDCFITDNQGVIQLLSSLLVGNEDNV